MISEVTYLLKRIVFMFNDDDTPKSKAGPKNLEPMSLDELEKYIAELKEEIVRTEAEITRKKAHAEAAASIFKK
tara:strand:- start:687 stop:908 length:222 start_codon:yes stop_codon:yes gene_type:complete